MSLKKKTGNRVCVFRAPLGDCEDPDLYATGAIAEFLETDTGRWLYENFGNHELMWYTILNGDEWHMGFEVHLFCNMSDKELTYWKLLKNENIS